MAQAAIASTVTLPDPAPRANEFLSDAKSREATRKNVAQVLEGLNEILGA